MIKCDFCNLLEPEPRYAYPCRDFTVIDTMPSRIPMDCIGEWIACETCRALIDADDRAGLLSRAMGSLWIREPAILLINGEERVSLQVRSVFEQFFAARLP